MERQQKQQLIEVLVDIPTLQATQGRNDVQADLPKEIGNNWPRRDALYLDLAQLVNTCLSYSYGFSALNAAQQ